MAYSGDAYKVLETSPLSSSVQNAMIDNIYQSLNTLDTGKASTNLATTSAAGLVELATDLETQTGTDTERAIVPASLHKKQWKTYLAQHFQRLGSETHVYSLASLGSGVVLAGTWPTGEIFKSTDSGATWTEIQRLGTEASVFSLASLGSGVVLAGTYPTGKIFKSTDSGATWVEIQRLGTETYAFSLVSLGSGVVLAGTYPTGKIYKSTDSGATWTEIQQLGSEAHVRSLVSLGSGVALAGTDPTGSVFRLQEVTISW